MSIKIRVHGEWTLAEIKQSLFEQLNQIEANHAVRYSKGATLYINPSNGFGNDAKACYENGQEVKEINCRGPYKSAADHYEP